MFLSSIYKSRGMQSTIYVEMAPGVKIEDLHEQLKLSYEVYSFILLITSAYIDVISASLQKFKVFLAYIKTCKNAYMKLVFNHVI